MSENIKSVFDRHGAHISFDEELAKRIERYKFEYVNRNDDHIRFFGSNLIGVYPVRFKTADKLDWTVDLLELEEAEVKADVVKLPTINKKWVRGTDVMNLSCLYLVHRFANSKLPIREREQVMFDTLMVLHFKLISSLMAHFFPYPVDERIAQAVYDELSLKYALKQHGSWMAVLEDRCRDILKPTSIHYRALQNFNNDAAIQYMVTDIQGRLRSIVKNLWVVLAKVRDRDSKNLKTKTMIELEGELVVASLERQFGPYKLYLDKIAPDIISFIKPELIDIICDLMPTMPKAVLIELLRIHVALCSKNNKQALALNNLVLVHVFDQFVKDRTLQKNVKDLGALLKHMRSLYTASRSKGDVEVMRNIGEAIIRKHLRSKNDSVIAATRTGLLLYIVLRTFARDYYS